jgi:hypothetical protein
MAPDPDAELYGAAEDVGEETCAEPSAFVFDRHPEAGQQSDRLRVAARTWRTRAGASSTEMLAIDQA